MVIAKRVESPCHLVTIIITISSVLPTLTLLDLARTNQWESFYLPEHTASDMPRVVPSFLNKGGREGKQLLICFPWAGGTRNSFASILKELKGSLLDEDVDFYCVSYSPTDTLNLRPRTVEDAVQCLQDEIDELIISYRSVSPRTKITFFGYSYGGIVAYEVWQAMHHRSVELGDIYHVDHLVLTAVASPTFLSMRNRIGINVHHRDSKEMLMRHIIDCGGLPKGIDPAFLENALPMVRWDYQSFETYAEDDMPRPSGGMVSSSSSSSGSSFSFMDSSPLSTFLTPHVTVLFSTHDVYTPSHASVDGWQDGFPTGTVVQLCDVSEQVTDHFGFIFSAQGKKRLLSQLRAAVLGAP